MANTTRRLRKHRDRVLVIGSDPEKKIEEELRRNSYGFDRAATTKEASTLLLLNEYNILLAEIPPDDSDTEFLKSVRKEHPSTDIILLSESGDSEAPKRARELGAYGCIKKPLHGGEIGLSVENLIKKQGAARMEEILRRDVSRQNRTLERRVEEAVDAIRSAYGRITDLEEILEEEAREADLERSVGAIIHEVRQPLTTALGYLELAQKKECDTATRNEYLKIVEAETRRANSILSDVRKLSKQTREVFDIKDSIEAAISSKQLDAEKRGIRIRTDYRTNRMDIVGHRDRLHQVFNNLIDNAIYAMKDGGELAVVVSNPPDEKSVSVDVTDQGCGIPKKVGDKIFEPGFTTKGEKGSGIGLPISRRIVHAHRGDLSYTSEEGKGTTFTVTIPHSGAPYILIIDKDPTFLDVFGNLLRRNNFRVKDIADPNDYLTVIGDRKPDIVMIDVMGDRDGIDGYEVCRRLKANPETEDIMRIISTCIAGEKSEKDAYTAGAHLCIYKPFRVETLIGYIGNFSKDPASRRQRSMINIS